MLNKVKTIVVQILQSQAIYFLTSRSNKGKMANSFRKRV